MGVVCKHFSGYNCLSGTKCKRRNEFWERVGYMDASENKDSQLAYRSVLRGFTEDAMIISADNGR